MTKLPETFTPEIFQESQSGKMQQTLIPTNSLTSISSVLDSLVRHFQLLEKGQDSTIPEVYYFLKSQKLHEPSDHAIYCLKTSKAFSISKMGRLLEKSSESLMNYTMMSRSVIITLRTTYHKTGHVSSLSELLEPPEKVQEKYYLTDKQVQSLLNGMQKSKVIHRHDQKSIAATLQHPGHSGGNYKGMNMIAEPKKLKPIISGRQGERVYDVDGISSSLLGSLGGFGRQTGLYAIPVLSPGQNTNAHGRRFKNDGEPMFAITASDKHAVYDGFRIRRLMPIECERLQGMPENHTKTGASGKEISDSQRYKCCGNAVSVPVVQHILERMLKNDES